MITVLWMICGLPFGWAVFWGTLINGAVLLAIWVKK